MVVKKGKKKKKATLSGFARHGEWVAAPGRAAAGEASAVGQQASDGTSSAYGATKGSGQHGGTALLHRRPADTKEEQLKRRDERVVPSAPITNCWPRPSGFGSMSRVMSAAQTPLHARLRGMTRGFGMQHGAYGKGSHQDQGISLRGGQLRTRGGGGQGADAGAVSQQDLATERDWYEGVCERGAEVEALEYEARQATGLAGRDKPQARRVGRVERETDRWEEARVKAAIGGRPDVSGGRRDGGPAGEDGALSGLRIRTRDGTTGPAFLAGANIFRLEMKAVMPVKDSGSAMARVAAAGSDLVKAFRVEKERKARLRNLIDLSSSVVGKVTGEVREETAGEKLEMKATRALERRVRQNDTSSLSSQPAPSVSTPGEAVQDVRRSLPAFRSREAFLRAVKERQVVIVIGSTGSGKTTQLPQYLAEGGWASHENGLMIGCTQPRRIAAVSVAERVSFEMGVPVGQDVGYAIRFEEKTSDKTLIKFMTDGLLLRESLTDRYLSRYGCIVLDEAHERSVNTDVLFGVMSGALRYRSDLRIIITSATLEGAKFSKYFDGAPVLNIEGQTFPVSRIFSDTTPVDFVKAAVDKAMEIHLRHSVDEGHILIFMTGQEDIDAVCLTLADKLDKLQRELEQRGRPSSMAPLMVLPIYSQLPADLQSKVFSPAPEGVRKCVVATNIAETSLTIDGITFVLDCGYGKQKVYVSSIGMDALRVFPVSKANAAQRAGRAGRTRPGTCFHLYSRSSHDRELLQSGVPEIMRSNLVNVVLMLKSMRMDPLEFNFLDRPPLSAIHASLYRLWILGALGDSGSVTETGKIMAAFPLGPSLSRMLLFAMDCQCADEMAIIVSMLSVPPVAMKPRGQEKKAASVLSAFQHPESDHLTLLNIFSSWKRKSMSAAWCADHFVSYKSLVMADKVREQLELLMKPILRKQKERFARSAQEAMLLGLDQCDMIRLCVCSGYIHHAGRQKQLGVYESLLSGVSLRVHPSSALRQDDDIPVDAEYVVYHELILTGADKQYMQHVTVVDPLWLVRLGSAFYELTAASERLVRSGGIGADTTDATDVLSGGLHASRAGARQQRESAVAYRMVLETPLLSVQDAHRGTAESLLKTLGTKAFVSGDGRVDKVAGGGISRFASLTQSSARRGLEYGHGKTPMLTERPLDVAEEDEEDGQGGNGASSSSQRGARSARTPPRRGQCM